MFYTWLTIALIVISGLAFGMALKLSATKGHWLEAIVYFIGFGFLCAIAALVENETGRTFVQAVDYLGRQWLPASATGGHILIAIAVDAITTLGAIFGFRLHRPVPIVAQ